jgi:hypothetical protein
MQTSSLVYMGVGIGLTVATLLVNRRLFSTGGVSALEIFYYVVAIAGLVIGWYFNIQYITAYGNQAGWAHWTGLLFVNPASASGGQDLIIANAVIFPVWTIVEARRSQMRAGWLYFPMSVLTSYAFALALFLALRERRLRLPPEARGR